MQILAFNTLGPSLRNKLEIKMTAHAGLICGKNGNGKQHKGKESGGLIKQQPVVARSVKAYVAGVRTLTNVKYMLIPSVVFFN